MTNFGAKIINSAISSLNAQQALIATSSNNIANVNNPNYARRTVNLQTRTSAGTGSTGINVGNGVEIGNLVRQSNQFIEAVLRGSTSEKFGYEVQSDIMKRVESLFSLTGDNPTIGSALTNFFSSIDDLSADPASIELRADVLARAQDLVDTIQRTFNGLADLQIEADKMIEQEVNTINSLTSQIANLNTLVAQKESSGDVAADERDRRDALIEKLAEKISFEMLELPDGTVTISLPNGFPLVNGNTSRDLEFVTSPSFDAASQPAGLGGTDLGYIVFDYDTTGAAPAHIDLTPLLEAGDGTVGGLLKMRGTVDPANNPAAPFATTGTLVEIADRIEALSVYLVTSFNETYLAPDGANGNASQAADLSGTNPAIYGFFTVPGAADADADLLPGLGDFVGTGTIFSSSLQLAFTDPARLAAARDDDYGTGGGNPPYTYSQGDNQNLLALSALQNTNQAFAGFGGFTLNGTFEEVYNNAVILVGNSASSAEVNFNVANDNMIGAKARRDEISAVSLDEEFTSLLQYQKAYEASARLLRTADQLLTEILNIL